MQPLTPPASAPRRLALALRLALAAGAGLAPLPLLAQAVAEEARHYRIGAGPLDEALNQFASQAGLTLPYAPARVAGKHSAGLDGRFVVADALGHLLRGTGLRAERDAEGLWRLVEAPVEAGALELDAATVTATTLAATTEGSGSYTTGSSATATRLPMSLRETPQSVSVVTRQRLDDQNLTQLTDVVRQTPGLSISQGGSTGSDSSPIYSRGFAVQNYQVDGEPLLNSNYVSTFQSADMVLYDRVEVIRGATGLMNGVGTPGATINLVRKRPTHEWRSQLAVTGGSWSREGYELDSGGPLNAEGTLRGRFVAAYRDGESYIDRYNERRKIAYGVIEADLTPDTLLTLGMDAQYHDADDHARGGRPLFNADGSETDWSRADASAAAWAYSQRHFVSAFGALEHRFSDDWKGRISLGQGRYEYDEVIGYTSATGYPDPATGTGMSIWAGRWAAKPVQDSVDAHLVGGFDWLGQRHDLVVGHSRQRTGYTTDGYRLWTHPGWSSAIPDIDTWDGSDPGRPPLPATSRIDYSEAQNGTYGTLRLRPLEPLAVILGARTSDWYNTEKTDSYTGADSRRERSETGVVTPFAGLVYDFAQHWSAYLSYTEIFKPQNYRTLDGAFIDPLEGIAYEAGVKAEFLERRLNVSAAVYQVEQDNLAVSLGGPLAPDGSLAYRAESGTRTRGVELELSGALANNWQVAASFSRNIVQDAQGATLNTTVPQNLVKLFTRYTLEQVGNGLTLGGGVNWQSEIYSVNQGPNRVRYTQDAYALVDLMASYPVTPNLTVNLNVHNLLDEEYLTLPSSRYYGEPRNATLGLRLSF